MSCWDWEDAFLGLLFAVLAAGLILGGVAICEPHNVDYYYLSRSETSYGYCVQAHWTWHQDETAFCTDDKDKALNFAEQANQVLRDRNGVLSNETWITIHR